MYNFFKYHNVHFYPIILISLGRIEKCRSNERWNFLSAWTTPKTFYGAECNFTNGNWTMHLQTKRKPNNSFVECSLWLYPPLQQEKSASWSVHFTNEISQPHRSAFQKFLYPCASPIISARKVLDYHSRTRIVQVVASTWVKSPLGAHHQSFLKSFAVMRTNCRGKWNKFVHLHSKIEKDKCRRGLNPLFVFHGEIPEIF